MDRLTVAGNRSREVERGVADGIEHVLDRRCAAEIDIGPRAVGQGYPQIRADVGDIDALERPAFTAVFDAQISRRRRTVQGRDDNVAVAVLVVLEIDGTPGGADGRRQGIISGVDEVQNIPAPSWLC